MRKIFRICLVLVMSKAKDHPEQQRQFSGVLLHLSHGRGGGSILAGSRSVSAAPQQSEICVKFSVFHTVFAVKFCGEIFPHLNLGKCSTETITPNFTPNFTQRKKNAVNGEIVL